MKYKKGDIIYVPGIPIWESKREIIDTLNGGYVVKDLIDNFITTLPSYNVDDFTELVPQEVSKTVSTVDPMYCSCNSTNVVDAYVFGEKYNYCRGCQKERL